MSATMASALPGTILGGKYQIERVLGEGGMGVVVSALHLHLGQRVALKFLLDHMRGDSQVVERFLREARAAVRLRSEHVGRVMDVGTLDTGAPFIVMEFLEGHDLATELVRRGPLPVSLVADYMLQALDAVAEAHALGIIHRDLKPANLFLTRRPDGTTCVKVLDFGIAKTTSEVALNLTQTATVMGSPGYMSPEQLRSTKDVDPRSDLWSLGVVMYELVSGHAPFNGETITELALRVALDPAPPLGPLPLGFDAIIYRCLEKDPARRFPDAAALAGALVPFGPVSAAASATGIARVLDVPPRPEPGPGSYHGSHATPTTLGLASSSHTAAGSSRRRLAWAGAGLTVAAAVATVVLARGSHGDAAGAGAGNTPAPITAPVAPPITPPAAPPIAAVTIDATVAAPPPDAAVAAVSPPDAAPVATQPLDAAPIDNTSQHAGAPAVTKRHPPARHAPTRAAEPPTTRHSDDAPNLEDSRY
ncbi:MAG TPA: serine/threonine-protein kinase [Kofleriaceae bacterium]|nr:serine/threonine-protein kinase [Kofleriaceae bacterium]